MSAQQIILDHDKWRKGLGGAPAGLAGQSDANAYAGLDLETAQFASSSFAGSSFTDTVFRHAGWTACQFDGCSFTRCNFEHIAMVDCVFTRCAFDQAQFSQSSLRGCRFVQCTWNGMNFDGSDWRNVQVLECKGTDVHARNLRGEQVDFTNSYFEQLEFEGALLNNSR
ncbi:pentapeptide repeat-containing protein [Variovorax paradoxus]|uniref:pentapeptide repeat-containing protein n=1 Tax=Variovorax paradoxus TaxID=34073 RepID=UPI003ECF2686